MAFASLGSLPVVYAGFLGPEATVPWQNNLQWLVFICANAFAVLQNASAGGMPGEHPAEPRTSIREPVLRSAIHALMMLDANSDVALIRSFLSAVCLS